jgi:hypothetical protein
VKKGKRGGEGGERAAGEMAAAARQFEQATRGAADVIAQAEKALAEARAQAGMPAGAAAGDPIAGAAAAAAAQGFAPVGGRQITGSIAQLEVSFPQTTAPPPAFASVCVVHRFPEYVLVDFGSIDPLQLESTATGQKALLQHVGRICLPESTARRLLVDLAGIYGQVTEGGA